jgi:phosphoribosyl 1,2-cyclic phosphodiesterase
VRLLFCGVRGSTSAPGAQFVRVGGHTSCVAIAHDDQPWTLVLDAGTGVRRVTDELGGRAFNGALLLTHLHWDHVQGLPFFAAGDRDDAHVRVFMPEQLDSSSPRNGGHESDAVDVLARAMSPPHFPIGPEGLRGEWEFESLKPGSHHIVDFDVAAFDVPHKGGRTFGYRVGSDRASIAYIPDHCPQAETNPAIARECAAVDLLVHDAQFLEHERAIADLYGHATVGDALDLAERCGARRLALFHHGPARSDDAVDAIGRSAVEAGAARGVEVFVACEEAVIDLAPAGS